MLCFSFAVMASDLDNAHLDFVNEYIKKVLTGDKQTVRENERCM